MRPLILVLALLALAACAFADLPARYAVETTATVTGESVVLADLVPNAPATWSRVLIGASPRPGRTTQFSAELVRARAQAVVDPSRLELAGPVTVKRAGREITRDEIETAVGDALAKRYGDSVNVSFESVTLPTPINDGNVEFKVRLPRGNLPTRTTLWVDVEVNGQIEARASARVECRAKDAPYVVVLTRQVKRGETIRPSDLELREGEGRQGALTSIEQAVGKSAVRSMGVGSVLSEGQLIDPILVEKGQTVRLMARVGRITAIANGKSLEKGSMGDTVSVQNTSSGQVVRGVVREAGMVEALAQGAEVN